MKILKKISVLAISLALILSLASCGDTSWVVKSGDTTVSSGMYIAYQLNHFSSMIQHEDFNPEIDDLMKQTIEDKKAKDYVNDKATEDAKTYIAVEEMFTELGLEFTEEELAAQEQQFGFEWSYFGTLYEQNSVGKSSYEKISLNRAKQRKIFDSIYGKGGTSEVPDADLLVHFKENYVDVNVLDLTTTNDANEPLSATEIEAVKTKAQGYVDRINAGESFNTVKVEYENEKLPEGEEKVTEIPDDQESKQIINKEDDAQHADLIKGAFDTKELNKAVLIEGSESMFVLVKYDVTADKDNFDEMRSYVLTNLKGDEFTKTLEERASKVEADVNSASISRYNPKNLSLEEQE